MAFSLDDFLSEASALKVEIIPPTETGLSQPIYIREMTASQRDQLQARSNVIVHEDGSTTIDMSSSKGAGAFMLSCCMVTDETGRERVFVKSEDPRLKKISGKLMDIITKRIREISGLTKEAKAEAKNE